MRVALAFGLRLGYHLLWLEGFLWGFLFVVGCNLHFIIVGFNVSSHRCRVMFYFSWCGSGRLDAWSLWYAVLIFYSLLGNQTGRNLDTCLWPAFIVIFTDSVATCLWQSFTNVLVHPIGFMVGFNVSSWWCWVMFCFSWCESGRFYGWCCGPAVLTFIPSLGIYQEEK